MVLRRSILSGILVWLLASQVYSLTSHLSALTAVSDPHSLKLMGISLVGVVDSVSARLQTAGWQPWGKSGDGEDFYFRGMYYGIRAKLMVTITPETHLVNSAYVTIGPYSTQQVLERNLQYFLLKLNQEHGGLEERHDAWLFMDDNGSIKLSVVDNDNGSRDIRVLYVVEGPYYKDAVNMGLHGPVQEVVTENAVSEDQFMHFSQDGQLENADLQERQYDSNGYLRKARMTEKEGYSLVNFEYDSRYRLVRRTLENPVAGISYVHEYTYNADGELQSETQKVWQNEECVLSITLYNSYLTRDKQGNWTTNSLQLSYWEKGTQSQRTTVLQKRTIAYWE